MPSSRRHGDPDNTFVILIATDNHLGYLEKDPIRGDDSFKAFEEILTIAQKKEVCSFIWPFLFVSLVKDENFNILNETTFPCNIYNSSVTSFS